MARNPALSGARIWPVLVTKLGVAGKNRIQKALPVGTKQTESV